MTPSYPFASRLNRVWLSATFGQVEPTRILVPEGFIEAYNEEVIASNPTNPITKTLVNQFRGIPLETHAHGEVAIVMLGGATFENIPPTIIDITPDQIP